jgi:flagellar FliL protein
VATKADADKSDAGEPAKAKPKSKKLLLIGGVAVLVLALVGGGAFFLLSKKNAADEEGEEVVHVAPKGPPTYLALDNMVVNLADPGGEKVAQVGITLELADSKSPEKVKPYLPIIRSAVLLRISQRTAEELLAIEGKEKLAADILLEETKPFQAAHDTAAKPKKEAAKTKKKAAEKAPVDDNPVRAVLFSSFIVQ